MDFGKKIEVSAQYDKGNAASGNTIAETASIDGSHYRLACHPLDFRRSENPDLSSLENEAGFANPFFHSAFVAASRDRMTSSQIHLLLMSQDVGGGPEIQLAMPIVENSGRFLRSSYFRALVHPYAPLGNPLITVNDTEAVLDRFMELLKIAFAAGWPPLVIENLSSQSAMFDRVLEGGTDIYATSVTIGTRPAFRKKERQSKDRPSTKRLRELRRLEKKLAEAAPVVFEKTVGYASILTRLEEFLLLEAKGWKGRQGSAIHSLKRNAAFARQAVSDLAMDGKASIYSLRSGSNPVSSMIVLGNQQHQFPWKIAFDEAYARYSPGSLLMQRYTEEIEAAGEVVFCDSLAAPRRNWMSSLWVDSVELKTLILAPNSAVSAPIKRGFQMEYRLRNLANRLKRR